MKTKGLRRIRKQFRKMMYMLLFEENAYSKLNHYYDIMTPRFTIPNIQVKQRIEKIYLLPKRTMYYKPRIIRGVQIRLPVFIK